MDLKQIEYILKIAEEKSITRAAEKLFLTQPALNQQLLRLEKELGTPLFIRGRKHLELTPAGEIYIKNATIMLDLKRETYREISDIAGVFNHSLKIGLTPEALNLLKEEPFVLIWKGSTLRHSIDNIFGQAGFVPRILFETESNITIVRMVQAGICHAILPAYYAVPAKNVAYSTLDSPFTFDVAACYRKKKKPDQASEYFLSLVQDFLNQNPVYQSYDR